MNDIIVKLNKKDIKEIIDKYLYITEDLTVKKIIFKIEGGNGAMGNPPDPYDLKEVVCFCEKIKKD